ncbi:hypothetical protein [Arthrobacter russicus]|jgi:hypothetical protein|uniref:Uncharacterized protein n=1 Tax=Arthrobacter russicus TaxID=172040 RepID=A0ABU1JIJ7_9MICC|nr:hypothetical protein [Arthrobacter russicus]MDN5669656.1 hypothetical protein [Renibacterium salmoninarum]MDR6271206.1 hypothetical protein [Arthrobacter russicus]
MVELLSDRLVIGGASPWHQLNDHGNKHRSELLPEVTERHMAAPVPVSLLCIADSRRRSFVEFFSVPRAPGMD